MTGRPQDRWGVLLLILSGLAVAGIIELPSIDARPHQVVHHRQRPLL